MIAYDAPQLDELLIDLQKYHSRVARDRQICLEWQYGGQTLAEIAVQYGMTRERVRQLVKKYGVVRVPSLDTDMLLTMQQASKLTGISHHFLKTWVREGKVPAIRSGYMHWIHTDDLKLLERKVRQTTKDRLLACLDRSTEHWLWTGYTEHGYGYCAWAVDGKPAKKTAVHRLAYEVFIGPIPPKHSVIQECGITLCCNPACLRSKARGQAQREYKLRWHEQKRSAVYANG